MTVRLTLCDFGRTMISCVYLTPIMVIPDCSLVVTTFSRHSWLLQRIATRVTSMVTSMLRNTRRFRPMQSSCHSWYVRLLSRPVKSRRHPPWLPRSARRQQNRPNTRWAVRRHAENPVGVAFPIRTRICGLCEDRDGAIGGTRDPRAARCV